MAIDLVRGRGLTLGYRGRVVLDRLDFTIERGDFLGVMGPNGSGKTTLIKAILGLLPPLKGAIEFPGMNGDAPRFGYVPQRERLDPHFPLSSLEVAVMGRYGIDSHDARGWRPRFRDGALVPGAGQDGRSRRRALSAAFRRTATARADCARARRRTGSAAARRAHQRNGRAG